MAKQDNSAKSANKISAQYASAEALESFHQYAKTRFTSVFNYEQLDEALRGIYLVPHEAGYGMLKSFCTRLGRTDLIGNCVIEYIHHSHFQAFASRKDQYYFIGISAALPALLQSMFQNLFSFTNPLTSFPGQATATDSESDETYVFPDRLMTGLNRDTLSNEISSLIKDTLPNERWQRIMATKMAEMAICFCIAHEIGHLVSGHTDIVTSRAIHEINEVRSGKEEQPGRDIGRWLSQSFELQADRIAIALMHSYVINTGRNRKAFMHYLRCKGDRGALQGRMFYAIHLVFLLLGQRRLLIDVKDTHPAPITRMTFIMAFVGSVLADVEGYDPAKAGDLVERYAEMAETAWEQLGFPNGRNPDTIDDLLTVVPDLQRAANLTSHYFKSLEWAVKSGKPFR